MLKDYSSSSDEEDLRSEGDTDSSDDESMMAYSINSLR
jgi:hypothetical protein